MKIKTQFHLLVAGIVILPILAFIGTSIYMRFFSIFLDYRDEFTEFMNSLREAGMAEPPALVRLMPFIFILVVILFVVFMSSFIARSITRSVAMLEDTTRRISEGELDLDVDIKGSNEITSLVKSLNKMRYALKEDIRRRSRFIMGITHDLKTPLALIKGYAEAIGDGVTEDAVARSEAVEIINAKADQLELMIDDLLNFVRMETGEWREQLKEINITEYINNLVKILSMDVELLHHKFISDIQLPENLFVPMEEKLVQRAFENLINNAIRHTPNDTVIQFTTLVTNNVVEISINDNGPGIDAEALPRVFEMFYRSSPSRREQGMGLGLAVVKWVVDYHGWSISVSAEKDKGASFTITIPLVQNR